MEQYKQNALDLSHFLQNSCFHYPTRLSKDKKEKKLARFVERQRGKFRKKDLSDEKINILLKVDGNFFTQERCGRRPSTNPWDPFLSLTCPSAFHEVSLFLDHQNRQYAVGFCSITHYVVYNLDVKDIKPEACKETSPFGSIERVLWHVKNCTSERFKSESPLEPSWMCPYYPPCMSTYFDGSLLYSSDLKGKDVIDRLESILSHEMLDGLRSAASKEEAASVMSTCDILDPFFYGKEGRFYKSLIAIKESTHPQPRRITYSVTLGAQQWSHRFKCHCQDLYTYGAAGRPPCDWRCRAIEPFMYEVGEYLWEKLYHHLSPASQVCPPTACQVLVYASSLKASIRPHKDNGVCEDNGRQTRTSTDKSLNSHLFGTSVVVLSLGDEMEFGLLTPKSGKDFHANQDDHEWNASSTVRVGNHSAYVLHPLDDENYMHSARFPKGTGNGKVRVAFVFRWLSRRCCFFCEDKKGPRKYAMNVPHARQKLSENGKGELWIQALGMR